MGKKILHVTVRADYGGAPNYINTMINNLSEQFDVFIACPDDKPYYEIWANNPKVKGIYYLPHRKFSLKHLFGLRTFVKKNEIQLIQANGKGAGVYGRMVKILYPNVKVLFAYRGFHIFQYNKLQKLAYFLYERIMLIFTDRVINVSKGEQQNCIKHGVLTNRKSAQIYNGIVRLSPSVVPELKKKYKDNFVITTLSRFDIQKNMGLMYQIALSLKDYKDIKFVFIGDGEDKEPLVEKARKEQLNNIDFVGFKNHDEIAEYLTISDLYLTTSRWEGLPFALVEAASMGLPIIATDVIGNNEVCLNDKNGILYPSEDADSATRAILKVYENSELLLKYAEGSKKIFSKSFTVDKMVGKHEKLYLETLNAD